jgi:hypothetical protein
VEEAIRMLWGAVVRLRYQSVVPIQPMKPEWTYLFPILLSCNHAYHSISLIFFVIDTIQFSRDWK